MTTASRRSLLIGATGLSTLAVGALSGCSSGAGSQPRGRTAPPAGGGGGTPVQPSAPAESAASGTPPAGGGAAPAGSLAQTSEIPVGSGKILAAERMVITQPTAGQFVGLSAVCTHQGCIVSQLRGASIVCGCHGSMFGLDGRVQKGPASKPLATIAVSAQGGGIVKG